MFRILLNKPVGCIVVFTLALAIRYVNLSHEPIFDELYHVLAGASWWSDGTFAIAQGEYTRASIFTRLIGVVYGTTNGDLDAIRLFCSIIGSLLVVAVFVGVTAIASVREGYLAAIMLAVLPGAIFLSQFIRFYSLHALLVWIGSIAVYFLVMTKKGVHVRVILATTSILTFAFAIHLQVTTFIVLAALSAWIFVVYLPAAWRRIGSFDVKTRYLVSSVSVILAVLAGIFVFDDVARLAARYQFSPLWNENTHLGYYIVSYRNQLGALWSLFPVAAVVALYYRPKPALFCVAVFSVALVLQTFGGMRAERYMFYAIPFFLATWSITLYAVSASLYRFVSTGLNESAIFAGLKERYVHWCASSVVAGSAVFLLAMTPASEVTVRMLVNKPAFAPNYWHYHNTSWMSAQEKIRELVANSDVFLTSHAYHALYFVGDFDVEISANGLTEVKPGSDGIYVDSRTGKRVIGDGDALEEIVSCNVSGVIVINERFWRLTSGVNNETADAIEENLHQLEVPSEWGMRIYNWNAADSSPGSVYECDRG